MGPTNRREGCSMIVGFVRCVQSLILAMASLAASAGAQEGDIARTADGRPDLSGTYDAGTLTPLQRPLAFQDQLYLTPEEAREIIEEAERTRRITLARSDPNRTAPRAGGSTLAGGEQGEVDGSFGAGAVGGYNSFWVDPGSDLVEIDGKVRTSIIYDPANGRQPWTLAGGARVRGEYEAVLRSDDGSAWWLDRDGAGPFDGPETVNLNDRCLASFSASVPVLPALYNNFRRVVQTEDHVMILLEMVHDARVVRLNARHESSEVRRWLGDSTGRWDGDTLIVDTTNFRSKSGLPGADGKLRVVERFTPRADGNLTYQFTVDDPGIWRQPWSGEYVWKASSDRLYEYACHEGNYAMGNMLRGARLLEREALAAER